MPTRAYRRAIATTPTRVDDGAAGRVAVGLQIRNAAAVSMYLGGPAVTAADGYELPAGRDLPVASGSYPLYAIIASGTTERLDVLEGDI